MNWKARFQNRTWVAAFVSQVLLIAQIVVVGLNQTGMIQFQWTEEINTWVLGLVNAVLVALSMLGVVMDGSTEGIKDKE